MFSDGEESCVLLGVVKSSKNVMNNQCDPYISKIGGFPVWLPNQSHHPSPVCRLCSSPLYLVAQIYAPVSFPRVLYIFGCNQYACSNTSDGWRLFRSQLSVLENKLDVPVLEKSSALPEVSGKTQSSMPQECSWGGDWNESTSGWTNPEQGANLGWEVDEQDKDIDDEIKSLLKAHENESSVSGESLPPAPVILQPEASNPPAPSTCTQTSRLSSATENMKAQSAALGNSFPESELEIVEEPWEDIQNDEDDGAMHERLQRYKVEEDDENLIKLIEGSMKAKQEKFSGFTNSQRREDSENEEEEDEVCQPLFLAFQQRLARAPEQVLRYAFEGQPLWLSSTPPKTDNIPPCICGAPRLFELQLMPTILYHLRVSEFVDESKNVACSDDSEAANKKCVFPVHKGMSWGVVTIWSCQQSCVLSNEEHILVQLDTD